MARAIVKIDEQAKTVTVTMPMEPEGTLSSSQKMELLACSRGNQETDSQFKGKSVYANVTIGVFAQPKKQA